MKVVFVLLNLLLLSSCSTTPPNPESFCGKPSIYKSYHRTPYGGQTVTTEVTVMCPIAIW